MRVTVNVPGEFQGSVLASLNRRKGVVIDTDSGNSGSSTDDSLVITADVPLNDMFGYSTELRSLTQGKGEFSMEYRTHMPVPSGLQADLIAQHQKTKDQQ